MYMLHLFKVVKSNELELILQQLQLHVTNLHLHYLTTSMDSWNLITA